MKVLISDDEYHVIQAIRLLVPWAELGIDQVFTASSGTEAIAIIEREIPEIVITDIVMEDKSGIDIMDYIVSRYPSIKVIAVSGHNDFEYVRTMLTKGCLDYLLKPLESATLVATVGKAVRCWKEEHESDLRNRHLMERVHSLSAFYSGVLLYKMLDTKNGGIAYQELLQADATFSSVHTCKILYYDTCYFPMSDSEFTCSFKRFGKQVQQFLHAGSGIMLSNPGRPGEIVLFLYRTIESAAASIIRMARAAFLNHPSPFHLGISGEHSFPRQFSDAYRQAQSSFLSYHADTPSCAAALAISLTEAEPDFPPESDRQRQLEDQIFSSLLIGDRKEIECAVSNWLASILPDREIPLYRIQYVIENFHRLFGQWICKIQEKKPAFSYQSEDKPLAYEAMTGDNFLFSRKRMEQAVLSALSDVYHQMEKSRSTDDIMLQIAQYMELNYTKPFVQSEYARRFYINKDYMSRKFTATFHVNMLTYLNQIRIRHARELLGDFSLKIQDIAYAVGFKDEKYFAKQFKRLTKITPGDYRAALRKSKHEEGQGY